MKRWTTWLAAVAVIAALCGGLLFIPLDATRFQRESIHSVKVFGKHEQLLREFLNDDQGRGEWVPLDRVSPALITATIAVEDRRFWDHPGVDPVAVLRAVTEHLAPGRDGTGGSTITQQVIRNVYHHPRTFANKITEAWYALRLERMMSKRDILEQYLNRAPYGNQLFGVQAAARFYFDKPASDLSLAEAAFLAGLPNAPTLLDPLKHQERAMARQHSILRRLHDAGTVTTAAWERALQQPVLLAPFAGRFIAPHAVEMVRPVMAAHPEAGSVITTIDAALQKDVERIAAGHLEQLRGRNVTNAAVVIVHNRTGEIRCLLGSADYFDDMAGGKINGALALRQPGSSVKIFTYGVALGAGFTPVSLLADIPTSIPNEGGDYVPENYDREYHGPVLLRTAFACSYNIPAVRVIHSVGVDAVYGRMIAAGLTTLTESPKHYGVGLTLGNAEVTLLQLTNAYRAVANGGSLTPMHLVERAATMDGAAVPVSPLPFESIRTARVFAPDVAWQLAEILSDHAARRPAFGNHFSFSFPCAVKTGTTKDYKDNWTLGFTTEYTVGVWVGNFDASPMRKVSGVSGAGQIFTDVMNLLSDRYGMNAGPFTRPASLIGVEVCARSGALRGPSCEKSRKEFFLPGTVPSQRCSVHRRFLVRSANGTTHSAVYEIFPAEYRDWCRSEQIPVPPPDALPVENVRRSSREALAIISPHPGDIFKVDPILRKEYQTIRIDVTVPTGARDVRVEVGKKEFLPVTEGFAWWRMERGDHQLTVSSVHKGKRIVSAPVDIHIE